MAAKYIAYVGSDTNVHGNKGLSIYEVDNEKGNLKKISEVDANNASYLKISADGRFLYVVVDEGVSAFKILDDGNLEFINTGSIRGMRGCYLDVDKENKYMFVAGMYDGKATVLRINEDGSVGEITDNFFNKGLGSVAETNKSPHITCVKPTPDGNYVCVIDAGMDQIKIMDFDRQLGRMHMRDMIHCEQESGPRKMLFDKTGRFMYVLFGKSSIVKAYSYDCSGASPVFRQIDYESTARIIEDSKNNTALAMRINHNGAYLLCSNGGDNTVGVFERNEETGKLNRLCVLPISGSYPIDIGMLPDSNFIFSVNNEEETITLFGLHPHTTIIDKRGNEVEKSYFSMSCNPIKVTKPNCMRIVKLER